MIAHYHARAIQAMEGGELHAIYGRRPESTAPYADEFGIATYNDIDAFLADPAIDIVTITTPSGAHLDPALAAAKAGKHVIVEKPIEVTPARADQMIAACAAAGVSLSGIFNRRFQPAMQALRGAVDAGRFGTLTMASATINWFRDQAYYDSAAWRGTFALDGGGALMNQGIHTIDQLLCLAGPVRRVSASTACLAHDGIEVEDSAVAMLEFASGALGTIRASTASWSTQGNPAEVHLYGDRGSAVMMDEGFRIWDFMDPHPEDDEIRATLLSDGSAGLGANDPSAIDFSSHQRNFESIVADLRAGRTPAIDGAEARRAVDLICAMYESANKGSAPVELS